MNGNVGRMARSVWDVKYTTNFYILRLYPFRLENTHECLGARRAANDRSWDRGLFSCSECIQSASYYVLLILRYGCSGHRRWGIGLSAFHDYDYDYYLQPRARREILPH